HVRVHVRRVQVDHADVGIREVSDVGEGVRLAIHRADVDGDGRGATPGEDGVGDAASDGVVDVDGARVEADDEDAVLTSAVLAENLADDDARRSGGDGDRVIEGDGVAAAGRADGRARFADEQGRGRTIRDVDGDGDRGALAQAGRPLGLVEGAASDLASGA